MAPRKIVGVVRVDLEAAQASPASVGKALGPRGINMVEFIRAYNEATAGQRGDIVPAEITIFDDRSFAFRLRTPPTASLVARAAGVEKGALKPNGAPIAWLTRAQVREIAARKLPDLNAYDLDAAERMVAGTAGSMGIGVRDWRYDPQQRRREEA
jgi:large subunit ribosomal protein L11